MPRTAEVLLERGSGGADRLLTYLIPPALAGRLRPGARVVVPVGPRQVAGIVLALDAPPPGGTALRPISRILEEGPLVSETRAALADWLAGRYLCRRCDAWRLFLPPGVARAAGRRLRLAVPAPDLERRLARFILPPGEAQQLAAGLGRLKRGDLSPDRLRRELGPLYRQIEVLLGEGYLAWREPWQRPRPAARLVATYRLSGLQPAKPTPKQAKVLAYLRGRPEQCASRSELLAACAVGRSVLDRLAAEGCLIAQETVSRRVPGERGAAAADRLPALYPAQEAAVAWIRDRIGRGGQMLLHGVTGSGKTEVYLRAIQEALSRGRQALLLVPEIALTSQLAAYFRSRISEPMAVLHSGLSPGERYDEWRRVKKGLVKLVIGARSSIFAPLESPGILIVDEEHDPSYKQEENVRYHARDLALVRGKMESAVVVLGSATPSLESYHNAVQKKFRLLSLPSRVDGKPLPEIEVLDMRQESGEGKERPLFSHALEEAIGENSRRAEQALLFLNRRGFSPFALCRDCGFTYRCPNCSVSLTYHLPEKTFRCHYCDYALSGLERCPECAGSGLLLFGVGTQRLEEEIRKRFPEIRAARMDRDTTSGKASHQRILGRVRRGEVNLLIGTQMITKGHDLPRVTLVGVVAADLSLNVPDFRAGERTFQLLTQVAGRAGRGDRPGRVIIQTYNPGHYSIRMAQAQDYQAFYRQETFFRKEMSYPPFVRLVNFRLEANSEARLMRCARGLEDLARKILEEEEGWQGEVEALGPAMAPLPRLRGKFRCQMLFKGKKWSSLHRFAERLLGRAGAEARVPGVKLIIDVDPVSML